jgi:hypothetical protein
VVKNSGKMELDDISNSNWDITTNRFVAYIDIMGFKDMLSKEGHSKVLDMMKKFGKTIEFTYDMIQIENNVKVIKFSDCIMVYSKNGTKESLSSLLFLLSSLMEDLLTEKIPFKGAISFGKMTIDDKDSIYFGQPLVDAYLLQEELHFYGIIVHSSAENEIREIYKNISMKFLYLINYKCPLKMGNAFHLSIYPIDFIVLIRGSKEILAKNNRKDNNLTALRKSIDNLRRSTSGKVRIYIDNTETYIDYIIDNIKKNNDKF